MFLVPLNKKNKKTCTREIFNYSFIGLQIWRIYVVLSEYMFVLQYFLKNICCTLQYMCVMKLFFILIKVCKMQSLRVILQIETCTNKVNYSCTESVTQYDATHSFHWALIRWKELNKCLKSQEEQDDTITVRTVPHLQYISVSLRAAEHLNYIICCMNGWENSTGLNWETVTVLH